MSAAGARILRILVSGRVQGVGYRAYFAREAERLALDGWVRNRLDGRVEAVVAGPPAAIETLLAAARRGPAYARVETLHAEEAGPGDLREGGVSRGFAVAPTV